MPDGRASRGAATPATLPVDGYGEDYDFWVEARAATRSDDDYDAWIKRWVLDVETQEQWIAQLGAERVARVAREGRRPTRGASTQARTRPTSTRR